jgi:hypothetical protein
MWVVMRGDVLIVSCGCSSSFIAILDEDLEVESSALLFNYKDRKLTSDIRHECSDK